MESALRKHLSCMSRHIRRLGTICLAVLFYGLAEQSVRADIYFGSPEIVQLISEQLAEGRKPLHDELARLGFDAEVEALQQRTSGGLKSLPTQSVIESLYFRAEASSAGTGDRLIGILLNEQAKRYAAIANDPVVSSFVRQFTPDQLNPGKNPISFAPVSSMPAVPPGSLPPVAERGIKKLSEVYAHQGLAQLRITALRTLRRPDFDARIFDRVVLESPDPEEALRRIITRGTPQPTVEVALRKLLGEAVGRNAALGVDPATMQIMEELSRDLPHEQKRYVQVENQLESRRAQLRQARDTAPSTILRSNRERATEAMRPRLAGQAAPNPGTFPSLDIAALEPQKNAYEKYINETFESAQPEPPMPSPNGPSSEPRTERKFSKARFSARAGRGVSVGGEVKSAIEEVPVKAIWLSNTEDNRFGRLFITFQTASSSTPMVAVSRVLFADSFFSAQAALSMPEDHTSAYRKDEILVLMSMDPSSLEAEEVAKTLKEKRRELREATLKELNDVERLKFDEFTSSMSYVVPYLTPIGHQWLGEQMYTLLSPGRSRLNKEYVKEIESYLNRSEGLRSVVTHPALLGRELAWSAVRIDFWSNRIPLLEKESMKMNGGKPFPAELKSIDAGGSSTWQYYERDALIGLQAKVRGVHEVVVTSDSGDGNTSARSHFSVAMFHGLPGKDAIKAEDGLFRRSDIEERFQPLLDWLATNHHDYMRLNDFSESFSLLRWLRSKKRELTIIEVGPQAEPIATPTWVNVSSGPELRP